MNTIIVGTGGFISEYPWFLGEINDKTLNVDFRNPAFGFLHLKFDA